METDGWKEGTTDRQTSSESTREQRLAESIDTVDTRERFGLWALGGVGVLRGRPTTSLHQPLRFIHTMEGVDRPTLLAVRGEYLSIAISRSQYP